MTTTVYNSLVKLCTDICKRNGKKKLLWLGDKTKTLNYSPKYDEMIEEIRKELNFTTLRYNRLDDMLDAVGIPKENLCTYCWNGKE